MKIRPYKGQIDNKRKYFYWHIFKDRAFNFVTLASGPVPRRPVTTDMVARRLVHSALGVRSTKTAEQRQAEKELLKAAKGMMHFRNICLILTCDWY